MKLTRILSFVLGLGAFVVTGHAISASIDNHPVVILLRVLMMWPRAWYFLFKVAFSNPGALLRPDILSVLAIVVTVAAPFFAIFMAKRLNRSRLDWFVLTFLFPYGLAVLAVLPRGHASANPYGGVLGHFLAVCTGKNCGRCGKAVPLSSRAGQRCPFCGAYWSSETTVYRN